VALAVLVVVSTVGTALVTGVDAPAGASGVATQLVVSTPTSLSFGTDITIQVTAEDASGDVVKDYTGTVAVTSTDPLFVPVSPSTLTDGKGTFDSTLGTIGSQTITATDTVTKSITGTSGPIAVVRPSAVTVKVTGSSLAGITASPAAVSPSFVASVTNYVMACTSETGNTVTLTLTAPAGNSITVDGQSGPSEVVIETLRADQAVVVDAPAPGAGTTNRSYWIRCLPPDFPSLTATVTKSPPEGWLLTGTGGGTNGHYSIIMTSTGTPVWWRSTGQYDSANLQSLQNDTLGWGWGFVEHQDLYNLNTGTTATLATNAHDLYQLPDGDFISLVWSPKTGVDLSAIGDGTDQTIEDCAVQEYNPQLKMVWSWDAAAHISPDESVLATESAGVWDIYHCNSIDADPTSSDPNNPNLLLSMRNTSGVYYIVNPEASKNPGQVRWKLGGVAPLAGSSDASAQHYVVTGGPGFDAQHDARFEANGGISVFDDASPALGSDSCQHAARGVQFFLHRHTLTATADWQYAAPSGECASFEGSFRRYADGDDNLIAWGAATGDFISEVNEKGQALLTISAATGDNYRAIKVPLATLDQSQLRQDMGGTSPSVFAVAPSSGPRAGGTVLTLSGRGFTQALSVQFGGVAATKYTVNSDESMTVTAPPSATDGAVRITVTNSAGTSVAGNGSVFTYVD
jgi:hypothetical protein